MAEAYRSKVTVARKAGASTCKNGRFRAVFGSSGHCVPKRQAGSTFG